MAEKNSPQLLVLYTTAALLFTLPRLTFHLRIPPTQTLLLITMTGICFFSTVTYLAMDACYTFTWIILKFVQFLLRLISPNVSIPNVIGVAKSPGTKQPRQWWEVMVAVTVGLSTMVYNIQTRGRGWTASIQRIEAKRASQRLSETEQGGDGEEGKESEEGRVTAYAGFAFLYTTTLMDSRWWVETWWRKGGDGHGYEIVTEQSKWEAWSFAAALCVASVVALSQWTWERKARKARVAQREFLDVREHFGEQQAATTEKELSTTKS